MVVRGGPLNEICSLYTVSEENVLGMKVNIFHLTPHLLSLELKVCIMTNEVFDIHLISIYTCFSANCEYCDDVESCDAVPSLSISKKMTK